jgi:sec-independent protein translocase protein TatA
MFGSLGFPEMLFILVLALLIFGPKRLPELGRTLGRGLSEFRKASNELKRSINVELALDEEPAAHHPQLTRREMMGDPPPAAFPEYTAPPGEPGPAPALESPEAPALASREEPVSLEGDRLAPIQTVPDPRAEPRSNPSAPETA